MDERKDADSTADSSDSVADSSSVAHESLNDRYIEAFGHRYHHSGKIYLPFDEDEQRRMETEHRLFRLCLNGALTATRLPLDVKHIVDLGPGTGAWPIEMAARYPEARIMGIDASPIQRKTGVPPNVKFEIDNVENPWPSPPNSLDFVHSRNIAGGVKDWPRLLAQAYEKLKPGGLLEATEIAIKVMDFNGKFNEVEMCPEFLNLYRDVSKKVGIDLEPTWDMPEWLVDIGFEKVVQRSEILPLGDWAQDEKLKARQALINQILADHFESTSLILEWLDNRVALFFKTCGWSRAEYDAVKPGSFQNEYDPSARPYVTVVFTTARKPRGE